MFALNFAPQAEEKNAYGQPAYIGPDHDTLNPAYFQTCDQIIRHAAARGLYVMLYTMWAGKTAGTMNHYTAAQLSTLGRALGRRYAGVPNVIFCVGGEATPPKYIEADRVNALGLALKEGCGGRNLVTVHPQSEYSSARFFANSAWLDFSMVQAKSSSKPQSVELRCRRAGAERLAERPAEAHDDGRAPVRVRHRGRPADPAPEPVSVRLRRSVRPCLRAQCPLADDSPHGAALDAERLAARRQGLDGGARYPGGPPTALDHGAALRHPYLTRIPDQSLVLAGQGPDVLTRVQATRDGTPGSRDATYLMAYLSAPQRVTLDTAVIPAHTLTAYWFSPETGHSEVIRERFANPGSLTLEPRAQGHDWVVVVEDASRHYNAAGKQLRRIRWPFACGAEGNSHVINGAGAATDILFALALPPFDWEWLGWSAVAPLLLAAPDRRPLESVGLGLLAGALCGVIHVRWHHNADALRLAYLPFLWLALFFGLVALAGRTARLRGWSRSALGGIRRLCRRCRRVAHDLLALAA